MTMREGIVFIDANILIYASNFKKSDVFQWIDKLYEAVYIHIEVYNELFTSEVREKVDFYIESQKWILYDPTDESMLSDSLYDLYESYVEDIKNYFRDLDFKKMAEGRYVKNTNDLGEIHSIAAAVLLGGKIICSNDLDIGEVIEDSDVRVAIDDEDSVLLEHDTLLDFCYHVATSEIAKRKLVKQFFKVIHPEQIDTLISLVGDE